MGVTEAANPKGEKRGKLQLFSLSEEGERQSSSLIWARRTPIEARGVIIINIKRCKLSYCR